MIVPSWLKSVLGVVVVLGAFAFASGCATPIRVIDSGGTETLTTYKLDTQDYNRFAAEMGNALLASPAINSIPAGENRVMLISRFQNKTGQQIETEMLHKAIRVTLLNSGKIITRTPCNEDPVACDLEKKAEFLKGTQARAVDYTLSGVVMENVARVGNVRQVTYTYQLTLAKDGLGVWEHQVQITKQGKKSNAGAW